MDIHSNSINEIFRKLSNFYGHTFEVDGVVCYSMEGFLQSLKHSNMKNQLFVCKHVGIYPKMISKHIDWKTHQILFWKGIPIERTSSNYQILLNKAYNSIYSQSVNFKEALHKTKGVLKHSIGNNDPRKTILSNEEFLSRLTHLRDNGILQPNEFEEEEFSFI